MRIDSYSFGSMTVDGKVYNTDLIIFPDRVKPNWWRKEGHSLAVEDIEEAINYKPEVLIIGKGASSCMEIPSATKRLLKERRIALVDEDTKTASQIFNEHIKEGKRAVGAFHLTC